MVWTSHNMYEVTEIRDRVLFLSRGKILLEGDPKTLPHERGRLSPVTLLGGGLTALYVVLACWFFAHIYRHALRTGLIARYSAETVS